MQLPGDEAAFDPIQDPQPQEPVPTLRERVAERQRKRREEESLLAAEQFHIAAKSNPQLRGEAQRIAQQIGVDPSTAERNIDVMRTVAAKRAYHGLRLQDSNPVLAGMMKDIEFARIAHDDIDNLSLGERIAQQWDVGQLTVERGRLYERMRSVGLTTAERQRLAEVDARVRSVPSPSNPLTGGALVLGQMSRTLPEAAVAGLATAGVFAGGAALAGQLGPQVALPEELATVPAAALTGFKIGATAKMAAQAYEIEAGNAYGDMLAAGFDKRAAGWSAVGIGVVNMGLEMAGIEAVMRGAGATLGPVRRQLLGEVLQRVPEAMTRPTSTAAALKFARGYATGVAGEVVTETLQEVSNIIGEELARGDRESALATPEGRQQIVDRLAGIAGQTALGMSLLALPGPGRTFLGDSQKAAAAERAHQFMQDLSQAATDSKVRERNPQAYEAYQALAHRSGAKDMYLDGETFGEVLRQTDTTPDDIAQTMPEVARQAEAARANPELAMDVVIPTSQFATHLAGTKLGDALMQHARFGQDGMSMAEAQEWIGQQQALAKEAGSLVQEKRAVDQEFVESGRRVEESLYQQIRATKRLPNAKQERAAAQFYRDFVVTQAAKRGLTPEQFMERYPLRVVRGDGQQAAAFDQLRTDTPEFQAWFAGSRVVDAKGKPLVVYHGARRPDRIGARFRKSRATSGPMAFFTDDPKIASNYATGKKDTSLETPESYTGWFSAKVRGARVPIDRLWWQLTPEERAKIAALAPTVTQRDEDQSIVADPENTTGLGGYDQHLKEARGNHLAALVEEWLNSAALFDDEHTFLQVLKAAGVERDVSFEDPNAEMPGVYPVFLSIKNPLDTSAISPEVVATIEKASKRRRGKTRDLADPWDKRGRSGAEWMAALRSDIAEGKSLAWTSIPDWVTDALQSLGYDGIKDTGGKMGGDAHTVLIPFEETQVKSVNNRGTFDPNDPNILRAGPRGDAKGGFIPETLTVLLNEKADVSTFLHESAHAFLTIYGDMAAKGDAQATADMATLLEWFGVKDVATWNAMTLEQQRKHHEKFAYSFEGYLFDGVAPSEEMRGLFDRFKVWLRAIYKTIRDNIGAAYRKEFGEDLPILTGEVRQVMDRMLASEQTIAEAEAVRSMVPMFQTQAQAKMDDGAWAAYQQMAQETRDAGVAELDRRSLGALQWSHGARSRLLKAAQAQHDDVRGRVRREVAIDVMRRPEYAVPRFIKTGELVNEDGSVTTIETEEDRHLNREAVHQYLNISRVAPSLRQTKGKSLAQWLREGPGISWESWQTFPGEQRRESVPKGIVHGKGRGGIAWDYAAEAARSEGYGPQNIEYGEDDYNWFIDALSDAAAGQHTYSEFETSQTVESRTDTREPPSDAELRKLLKADIRAADKERARRAKILKPFRGLLSDKGASPDAMAEAFADYGVTSGEHLIRLLVEAAPMNEAIDARTDERMHAEHSDLADPAEVEAAVERALHNEARARFVAAELRHLQGATAPVRVMLAAAKEAARQAIAGMPLRDVSAKKFAQAEARAARKAMDAMKKGDSAEAAEWQQKRLLQHALSTVAGEVQQDVAKELRNIARFRKPDAKLAKSRNIDLVNAARWILSRYNLGTPNQAASATKALQAVAAYDANMGAQLAPLIADADQNGRDYRDLSVDQFRDLMGKVDGLWNDSRRNQQIRLDGKLVEKAEARERIVAQLAKAAAKGRKPVSGPLRGLGGITASLRHVESWALEMDGGQPGPVHDLLFRMLRDRYDDYLLQRKEMAEALQDRIKELPNLYGRKYEARYLKDKNGVPHVWKDRAQVLGWVLHLGNLENARKDAVGRGWVVKAKDGTADLSPVFRELQRLIDEGHVTKADMQFVQGSVWDTYEHTLKPKAQAAHKDVYGYYFTEVESAPLELRFPDGSTEKFRGGYAPAKADPDLEEARPGQVSADGITESGAEFADRHPSAPKGFTITRTGVDRALMHDLRMVPQSFAEELQFIHMQRAGKDLAALLNDKDIAAAIRAVDPDAIESMFQPWLSDTMRDRLMAPGGNKVVNRALVALRRNVGMAHMFGNLSNAFQQLTGLATAATYVPPKHLRAGARIMTQAGQIDRMKAASKYMRLRIDKRLGQITDDIDGALKTTWTGKAAGWTRRNAYFLQRWFQMPVDLITWFGAHDQAMAQGKTDAQAVAWADAAVRRSQGSGVAPDISRFERSSAPIRLLTQFGGFWLAQFNTLAQRHGAERATAAANVILFAGVTAGAISQALKGGWDDDDEDGQMWDDVLSWTFGETVRTGASLLPVIGPAAYVWTTGDRGGRASPMAVVSTMDQAARGFGTFAAMFDPERDVKGTDIKATGLLLATFSAFPWFSALARPASYATDVQRGNVVPSGPGDAARGLLTGSVAPGTRQ